MPASPPANANALGKPPEIEEAIDIYLHRPLARFVVKLLLPTPITPNQVTLLAGFLGCLAGLFLGWGAHHPALRLLAAGLLFLSVILDCADGQLARARQVSSTIGAILDGVADYLVCFSCFVAATYVTTVHYQEPRLWWLGVFAGLSTVWQCALYDHIKNRYVARVGLSYHEREEDLDRVAFERMQARQAGRYQEALLLWVYERYSRAQRAALQREAPAEDPEAFRQKNRARMRAWATLGVGTHLALLYLAAALSYWWPVALLGCLILYATVMNAVFWLLFFLEQRPNAP